MGGGEGQACKVESNFLKLLVIVLAIVLAGFGEGF